MKTQFTSKSVKISQGYEHAYSRNYGSKYFKSAFTDLQDKYPL